MPCGQIKDKGKLPPLLMRSPQMSKIYAMGDGFSEFEGKPPRGFYKICKVKIRLLHFS